MKKHFVQGSLLVGLVFAVTGVANAATEATPSPAAGKVFKKGTTCIAAGGYISDNAIMRCGALGSLRFDAIYERGWRVASTYTKPTSSGVGEVILIIEEQ
jgi:hypothetical protein